MNNIPKMKIGIFGQMYACCAKVAREVGVALGFSVRISSFRAAIP